MFIVFFCLSAQLCRRDRAMDRSHNSRMGRRQLHRWCVERRPVVTLCDPPVTWSHWYGRAAIHCEPLRVADVADFLPHPQWDVSRVSRHGGGNGWRHSCNAPFALLWCVGPGGWRMEPEDGGWRMEWIEDGWWRMEPIKKQQEKTDWFRIATKRHLKRYQCK